MKEDDMDSPEGPEEQKVPELKIDARAALAFVDFFEKLPQDPQVMRFFDRKEYYTAHGEHASLLAREYFKTMTVLRQLGASPGKSLASVSISRTMFETILRDLLLEKTDHVIELYEGSGANWRVTKTGTPGKLGSFEDVLFHNNDMQDSPVVMAINLVVKENERSVGMAFVDMTKRTLGMTEFLDDDQYTNLEYTILALGCKEIVLPQDGAKTPDGRRLRDVISRCNVLLVERKRSDFKARDVEQDLSRLVKGSAEQYKGLTMSETPSAAMAALLAYTDLMADDSSSGKYVVQPYSLDTYMRLDAAALRALNVLESKTDANKNFSIFGLMNRTSTAGMGKRLLNRWLKQPLLDVAEIACRHDIVEAFVTSTEMRQDMKQHMRRLPDIERLTRKVERRKASLHDIVKLYQASVRLPFIKDILGKSDGQFSGILRQRYVTQLEEWTGREHLGKYEGLVEAAVDLDQIENNEYIISPGYDPSLANIKKERDVIENQIRRTYEQVAGDLDLELEKTLKLDRTTQAGYVFRITKKEEPRVRKKLLGAQYTTLETRKDGIKFTSQRLRRLSEQYVKLTEEYTATQRELVNKVVEVAATFLEIFESVAALVAELDVLLSFADLSISAPTPYVRPSMTSSTEGNIILEGSRHPCVEVQEGINFIPNDCRLERGRSWFQIITGPNMGGKSTFIRQVGVIVLMAQVGCFVPCDHAEISVRDCIFARVGAGDCQLRGVSTFMAEMLETAAILKAATANSLIIIDELGRGTSTYDGFGLAWAICEYLVEVTQAPTLFATHFHELTALAHSKAPPTSGAYKGPPVGVFNRHVSAHIDDVSRKLTMLYRVEDGPCDQSFGIHVAEFAHFPESVVELARKKAAELEDFSPQIAPHSEKSDAEQVGSKRKRVSVPSEDSIVGAAQARQFLKDFAALPLDEMEPEAAMARVKTMLTDLDRQADANSWLKQLLQVASST
eukprot:SM000253S09023  [mRNA]  locus=s253:74481:80442:+ [translate_table: standard]